MKKFFLFLLLVPAMLVQAQTQITCAEARVNASGVSGNNVLYNDGETFVVRGYVTNIVGTWSSQYKNISFWMADTENGGNIIQAFRCVAETEADVPSVGDLVDVTGNLTKYNSTPQIAAGCTYQLVSSGIPPVNLGDKTIAEFLAMKNTKDTCILTGVVANIVMDQTDPTQYNVYGNFDLVELGDPSVKVYIYGLLTPEKQSKQFRTMGVDAGDTLTLKALYSEYNNNPQVPSGIYVSHRDYVEPTSGPIDYTKTVVDFETDFAQGWDGWIGKTLTFTNDFYYCYSTSGAYNVAPRRLRAPEEYGEEGTAAYNQAAARNTNDSCTILNSGLNYKQHRYGTRLSNVQAYIPAAHQLQVVNTPTITPNAFPTERPDLGNANLVICGANIENFFVENVGSESHGAQTQEQLEIQKAKIKAALTNMNADIYALCEVEQGTTAVQTLVDLLNDAAGSNRFTYINTGSTAYNNSAMVCIIYDKNKVTPYGSYLYPYTSYNMKWREAIQCFTHTSTGEKFNISINHFWAKISKTDADREDNMTKLIAKLSTAAATDPDILVLGDLNAYTMETSNQMLIQQKHYVDLLMKYDPEGYSHLFDNTAGFLDHAFCSPSMESQVTKAVSYHLNADVAYKNGYNYQSGNTSMYRYADHDPILVGLHLGTTTPIENVVSTEPNAQKILRNGQIIIIRSGVEYTITGQRVY